MPSFNRQTDSPKQTSGRFNFSFGDSSKMSSSANTSELPLRFSAAASDRESAPQKDAGHSERSVRELSRYLSLLKSDNGTDRQTSSSTADGLHVEELLTTPLFSWSVKLALAELRKRGRAPDEAHFEQFALLGQERRSPDSAGPVSSVNPEGVEPIFLNTNAPWSAFLCGSQGSGKSHTLACMLEGCLMPNKALGRLPAPLQGIVFHCDAWSVGSVCEAAHLCSIGIKVNVLVSPSNYWRLKNAYGRIPDPRKRLRVRRLKLKPHHLNVERMLSLMAFNESSGRVPLYMEVINKILRDMATSARGDFAFDYAGFRHLLDMAKLTSEQKGPMNLRLQLLESFLDVEDDGDSASDGADGADDDDDIFTPAPGSLTIVDLTDPFIDASSACTLFDICLALFLEDPRPRGRIVALDEAHKYMTDTAASERFTDSLLTTIRIQRHAGTRVVVATQEPTVSPKLLDLCSMTVVHRFTSPAWLAVLRERLAGLSAMAGKTDEVVKQLFEEIVTLKVGESLLFAPSAMVRVVADEEREGGGGGGKRMVKLGTECVRFRTRPRMTSDGGRSVLAIR